MNARHIIQLVEVNDSYHKTIEIIKTNQLIQNFFVINNQMILVYKNLELVPEIYKLIKIYFKGTNNIKDVISKQNVFKEADIAKLVII